MHIFYKGNISIFNSKLYKKGNLNDESNQRSKKYRQIIIKVILFNKIEC